MTRKIIDAATLERPLTLEADVVVVGTGAGGATSAEILAKAGLRVVMLEEGGYVTAKDFTLHELDANIQMFYDGASRRTKDGGVTILQGRTVGGSTTINWTASFRTPERVLSHWSSEFGVKGLGSAELAPWFERVEKRLNVTRWDMAPNPNNEALARGCQKMGFSHGVMARNVTLCKNLGFCSQGCPVNAKRSMLVTSVPGALDAGATLVTRARAERVLLRGDKAIGVQAAALDGRSVHPTGKVITVQARFVVAAGGAINTPGLLLRSKLPDPHARLGKRTCIHPTNISAAIMPDKVDSFAGAPQSIYSDHFLWRDGLTGRLGYKLEAAAAHPMLYMSFTGRLGRAMMQQFAADFRSAQILTALQRDGFNEQSHGGQVVLRDDGSPVLDYPLTDYIWDGFWDAYLRMAEIQFAAGAVRVMPFHLDAKPLGTMAEVKAAIANLPKKPISTSAIAAHLMGGCGMGEDPKTSVVNSLGRHHQIEGLAVIDGSVLPTSLGVNPQITIYGISSRNATLLARDLGGKTTSL